MRRPAGGSCLPPRRPVPRPGARAPGRRAGWDCRPGPAPSNGSVGGRASLATIARAASGWRRWRRHPWPGSLAVYWRRAWPIAARYGPCRRKRSRQGSGWRQGNGGARTWLTPEETPGQGRGRWCGIKVSVAGRGERREWPECCCAATALLGQVRPLTGWLDRLAGLLGDLMTGLGNIKIGFRLRDLASFAGGVELGHDLLARYLAGGGGGCLRVGGDAGGDVAGVTGLDVLCLAIADGFRRRSALGEDRAGG